MGSNPVRGIFCKCICKKATKASQLLGLRRDLKDGAMFLFEPCAAWRRTVKGKNREYRPVGICRQANYRREILCVKYLQTLSVFAKKDCVSRQTALPASGFEVRKRTPVTGRCFCLNRVSLGGER